MDVTWIIVAVEMEHGVYNRVVWNPGTENQMLASVSNDTTGIVFSPDGKQIRKLRHPSAAKGAAWCPLKTGMLATTCDNGSIYVWDMENPLETCLVRTLSASR